MLQVTKNHENMNAVNSKFPGTITVNTIVVIPIEVKDVKTSIFLLAFLCEYTEIKLDRKSMRNNPVWRFKSLKLI